MAVSVENEQIASPGQVFIVNSEERDQLIAIAVPITNQSARIIDARRANEAHIGIYNVVLSISGEIEEHQFPKRLKDSTGKFAPITIYKKDSDGNIYRINALFMTQRAKGRHRIPQVQTKPLRLIVGNS